MTRKQLLLAFIVVSALQWLIVGCAAPRPVTCLKVTGDETGAIEYTAMLTFGDHH